MEVKSELINGLQTRVHGLRSCLCDMTWQVKLSCASYYGRLSLLQRHRK